MVANPVNRRFATGLAGPNFNPVDILNIGLDNWFRDPYAAATGNLLAAAAGFDAWIPPEFWSAGNNRSDQAALVPAGWVSAGARIVLHGGAADSFVRIGAFTDAMLNAYLAADPVNGISNMMAAHAPIFKVPANQTFDDTFAVPPNCSLVCQVLVGGVVAPSAGIAPYEVHWMLGV